VKYERVISFLTNNYSMYMPNIREKKFKELVIFVTTLLCKKHLKPTKCITR